MKFIIRSFFILNFILISFSSQAFVCSEILSDKRQVAKNLLTVEPASIRSGVGIKQFDKLLNQRWFLKTLEKLIGLQGFNETVYLPTLRSLDENFDEIYEKAQKASQYDLSEITAEQLALRLFIESLYLQMDIAINEQDQKAHLRSLLELVPEEGEPAIAIANHPYGIIEGLIFSRTLLQRRPDVKFIANSMLGKLMPPTKALTFSVDIVKGQKRNGQNSSAVDLATEHVNEGGLIAIFPDPLVPIKKPFYSNEDAKQNMDFKTGVSRIALETEAQIVMAHIGGGPQNSMLFHLGGHIHLVFKLVRHMPEFIRNIGVKTFTFTLAQGPSSQELIAETLEEGDKIESMSHGERRSLIKKMTNVLRDYYLAIFPEL